MAKENSVQGECWGMSEVDVDQDSVSGLRLENQDQAEFSDDGKILTINWYLENYIKVLQTRRNRLSLNYYKFKEYRD